MSDATFTSTAPTLTASRLDRLGDRVSRISLSAVRLTSATVLGWIDRKSVV